MAYRAHQLDRPLRCEERLQDDGVAVQQGVEERGERGGMVQRPDDELPLRGAPAGLPDHQGRRPGRVVAQWSRPGGDFRNARARAGCQQVRHGAELAWAFGRGAGLPGPSAAVLSRPGAAEPRRCRRQAVRVRRASRSVAAGAGRPSGSRARTVGPAGPAGRPARPAGWPGSAGRRAPRPRAPPRCRWPRAGYCRPARRHTTVCAGPAQRPVRRPRPRPGRRTPARTGPARPGQRRNRREAVRSGSARAMSAIRRRTDRTIVTAGSLPAGGHWPRS